MTDKYKSIRYYFQELPRSKVRPARGLLLSVLALVFTADAEPAAAPVAEADARFEAAAARYVEEFGRYSPVAATQLGDHRFDAELEDMSAAGRARTIAWARGLLAEISAHRSQPAHAPEPGRCGDARQPVALPDLERRDACATGPGTRWSTRSSPASRCTGCSRATIAPLPQRLSAATARLEKLPRLLEQMRANLDPARVPAIHAETAVKQNPGVLSLIDELIVLQLGTLSEADQARLRRAIEGARAAVQAHQKWLETELKPAARGEFRIGAELYDQKLAFALMSPLSRAEIRRRADAAVKDTRARDVRRGAHRARRARGRTADSRRADDAQQQAAIAAALELAYAERPARDGVVEAARATVTRDHGVRPQREDFVSVPAEPLEIILMPEFQRGVAVAYCDSPGPLDTGQRTFYAVSPIPDDWTEEQVDSFLREYNTRSIAELTIHEAMPGHYLQIAHSNRYPSVLRALLASGPFVEGWAVYTERVMIDQGFRRDDPLMRLIQLKWYLRAVTNAIMDSAIHVDGMTREQAMKLMTETGFQEEREAAGKWVRAQLTSAQLRRISSATRSTLTCAREAEARAGDRFDLKSYHDRVLVARLATGEVRARTPPRRTAALRKMAGAIRAVGDVISRGRPIA